MTFLLDTSVLVAAEQQRPLAAVPPGGSISVVTLEELWLGVRQAGPDVLSLRQSTVRLAEDAFDALPVDRAVALASAEIRAEGRGRAQRYGLADSLIAATARVRAMPLYTRDEGMLGMVGVDVRVV